MANHGNGKDRSVRYTDGPAVECDVYVDAEPARVWNLITDIRLSARFSPELQRVHWLDGVTEPSVGARFEGHNTHQALGEWRTISHVMEFDAPNTFEWAVVDPDGRFGDGPVDPNLPGARWHFRLTPEGEGTRLRHGARIGPSRSGLSVVIDRMPDQEEAIIDRRLNALRAGITATLEGVKALSEAKAPDRSASSS